MGVETPTLWCHTIPIHELVLPVQAYQLVAMTDVVTNLESRLQFCNRKYNSEGNFEFCSLAVSDEIVAPPCGRRVFLLCSGPARSDCHLLTGLLTLKDVTFCLPLDSVGCRDKLNMAEQADNTHTSSLNQYTF